MMLAMSSGSLSRMASAFWGCVFHSEERRKKRDMVSCLQGVWPRAQLSVECFPDSVAVTFPLGEGEGETYFVSARAPSESHTDKYERWRTDATLEILSLSAETAIWAQPIACRKKVSLEVQDGEALEGARRGRMKCIRACVARIYGAPRFS